MITRSSTLIVGFILALFNVETVLGEENLGDPRPGEKPPPTLGSAIGINASSCQSSPISAPKSTDTSFVADCGGGLDTGCTFRSGGPLVIKVPVKRVLSAQDLQKLKNNNFISETVVIKMPAYDVDFSGGGSGVNPERDRVYFNGNIVPTEFLRGDNNVWRMNEFFVPIEWVQFADDPGYGNTAPPKDNIIQIDIDTANSYEYWCTAIDWAAITIDKMPRPVVMVHGILSDGNAWDQSEFSWVQELDGLGIANSNYLNMGNLDSIQNNAAKIQTEVTKTKQRYGVDKVNIVAHSKGGIDSRHFVETDQSVERLIQLGTPNSGSPLADLVQGILVGTIGLPNTAIANALAGPAGIQLTTPFMATYNLVHGENKNVVYTALAGDYDPDCPSYNLLCRPIERMLLSITGPGDTIVPVKSVHSLSYIQNKPKLKTVGEDKDALHTSINKSERAYNLVDEQVRAPELRISALPAQAEIPVVRTSSIAEDIAQGNVKSFSIPIDQSTFGFFSLLYPSGNLDLALISPSGKRFDATTIMGNPDATRDDQDILGGRMEVYYLSSTVMEVGSWMAEVSAPEVTESSGIVGFGLNAWLENPAITLEGGAVPTSLKLGEVLMLKGVLLNNGSPLINASVTAKIVSPDDSIAMIPLTDNGTNPDATADDGVYSGSFNGTTIPGNYRINIMANRGAAAVPAQFSREVFTLATVSNSESTVSGPFNSYGEDTDGDGFFNSLVIEVGFNITTEAKYHILAILEDNQGNTLETSFESILSAGSINIPLRFDGEQIFTRKVDGPYQLKLVRLSEEDDTVTVIVDERSDMYQTAVYRFTEFQHTPIYLTGDGTAIGVDTNGNGLYDVLNVSLDVEVRNSGTYTWSSRLTNKENTEVGFAASSGYFNAGTNSIILSYDGKQIGSSGVNGPYYVRGLLMFGGGDSLLMSDAFITPAFLAKNFEGFVALNEPPSANAGNDQVAIKGILVTLSGSGYDPDNGPSPLTFLWEQTSGPSSITLTGANTATPSFVANEIGTYTFTLTVGDGLETASDSVQVVVIYDFTGFFPPVDNPPVSNTVKAGSAVPVKFSLKGDQGMAIFAAGSPASRVIACDTTTGDDPLEETATAGSSGLNYDPTADMYNYIWKTDKAWSSTCRQLTVKLIDGTSHKALFKFTK